MDFTYEAILGRIAAALQNPVNRVEGGFSMDNAQAVAQEIARLVAMEVSLIPDRVFLDTAEGAYLDRKGLDYNEQRLEGESDDAYRARILQKIQNPLTSGNENHYVYWAKKVPGVGDAKCVPGWNGPGTVKVIVLSDMLEVPTEETLRAVSAYIEGNRPVGASVTVEAAVPILVSITVELTLEPGSGLEDAKAAIIQDLRAYLAGIAFKDNAQLSYYRIGDRIFNAPGVRDITAYSVNGGTASIPAGEGEFFRLQEVTVHEAQ